MLQDYPKLSAVTNALDGYLKAEYPRHFGPKAVHPHLPIRPSKVIHDNLWGTNAFSWRELVFIDTPVFQRLRNIHQTGLAYLVYPSAHHTRFEHSLGVCIMASRVYDALARQHSSKLREIAKNLFPERDLATALSQWRAELRLAALMHDTGHSLHSHTSEQVYSEIPLLIAAAQELSEFVGARKGVGEVLSFCFSQAQAIRELLERARTKLIATDEEGTSPVDYDNVSLLIVGRSKYPLLQFLGEIISSDLDADKLDYLLRDATAAGLPLRYDLERYLYTVGIEKENLGDGEGKLQRLYGSMKIAPVRHAPDGSSKYPYYDAFQLRLPRQATNTIEQIIICKFMLFSYIYHHRKVRAAEGMLARLIRRRTEMWRAEGRDDVQVLTYFLQMTDSALDTEVFKGTGDVYVSEYRERLQNRLIPREVIGFIANLDHPEAPKLSKYMSELLKKEKRSSLVAEFEKQLAEELGKLQPDLGKTQQEVLTKAGVWFDVPKEPNFNKLEELLIGTKKEGVVFTSVFPITSWIQAYLGYRYHVRVFAFSEYFDVAEKAACTACGRILDIKDPSFFKLICRARN